MAENKHTPWTVVDNSWEISTVYDANGTLVATCQISDEVTEETQEEYEAEKDRRARLIAAAPDLLRQLQQIMACLDVTGEIIGDMDAHRAAIARATQPGEV